MQQHTYSARERVQTGHGPMDLDAGRFDLGETVKLSVTAGGLWAVGCAGSYLALVSLGWSDQDWRAWALLRAVAALFGAGVALGAWALGGTAAHVLVTSWYSWRARLADWHGAELEAYERAGGQQVDRTLTIKTLSVAEPSHLLLVGLALAEKVQNGQAAGPSAAALTGPLWCGRIQVGELTKAQAEEFARALAQVGLISSRKKGAGGQLAAQDMGQAYTLLTTQAGRARQLPEYITSEEG